MALPGYSPTEAFFNPMLGGGDRGPWLNRLSYSLFFKLALLPYRGLINRWRSEALALPPVQSELVLRGQPIPKLYSYSPQIVPIPQDWDDSSVVTGYWFLDRAANWEPPADLVAFLAQGAPPVYVGFGSMVSQDAEHLTRLTLDALHQSGQRAILATGWGGLSAEEVPNQVYVLKAAPHDWLFSHCAAVVHHGGAGTTGAGLRAGKPTLICPFIGDQPFWGQRVFELGVGPHPIPQRQLTSDSLTQALRTLVTDAAMQQRAADLGASIRDEQGVACAVEVLRQRWLE
jgi:sterol 3beta-glucosyltransferase